MITQLIIQGCLHEDRKCQRILYEYCFPIMMRVCKRYTINEDEAVESMNASFLKILNKLDTLKDLNTLPAWVKQVSVNTSIDYYRAKRRYQDRNRFSIDKEYSRDEQTFGHMDFTESKMDSAHIFKWIQELPDTTREVLNLAAIDGFSHREVAGMLQISEEASRWHLHRARKLLLEKMKQNQFTLNVR